MQQFCTPCAPDTKELTFTPLPRPQVPKMDHKVTLVTLVKCEIGRPTSLWFFNSTQKPCFNNLSKGILQLFWIYLGPLSIGVFNMNAGWDGNGVTTRCPRCWWPWIRSGTCRFTPRSPKSSWGMGFHGFFPCNNPHGRVARGELDEIFGSNQHHGSLVVNI